MAAWTRCAADREGVTISMPCTGVNDKEVDVPLAASDESDLPSSCVRILLARESLAVYQWFALAIHQAWEGIVIAEGREGNE